MLLTPFTLYYNTLACEVKAKDENCWLLRLSAGMLWKWTLGQGHAAFMPTV